MNLLDDVESLVLAMWGEPEEEVTREVMSRFNIGYEQAYELVLQAIAEELNQDDMWLDNEEWNDFSVEY